MMPSGSLMFCGQMAHLAAAMRVHVKQLCKYQFSPNCQCWRAWELHIRPYICILQLIIVQRTQPQQEPGRFNLMRNSISSMWKENYKTEFLFSLFLKKNNTSSNSGDSNPWSRAGPVPLRASDGRKFCPLSRATSHFSVLRTRLMSCAQRVRCLEIMRSGVDHFRTKPGPKRSVEWEDRLRDPPPTGTEPSALRASPAHLLVVSMDPVVSWVRPSSGTRV